MKFEPAPDYENLLRQARGLVTIVHSKERQCSLYEKTIRELKLKIAGMSADAVNAERETNRLLTDRVEALESAKDKEHIAGQLYMGSWPPKRA